MLIGKVVHITNQERIKKYIKELCNKCKNKNEFDCEIRVFQSTNIICTKCVNYESERKQTKKQPASWQKW